ncbi:hypothetical protein ATE84_1936 [Aquimarina sp. MAR_2010_214]|nr:hypothetical protein ATE84_1936 [Aquimarina sp. MAR_2010_214]
MREKHQDGNTFSSEKAYPENRGTFTCGKTLLIVSINSNGKYSFVINIFFQG